MHGAAGSRHSDSNDEMHLLLRDTMYVQAILQLNNGEPVVGTSLMLAPFFPPCLSSIYDKCLL